MDSLNKENVKAKSRMPQPLAPLSGVPERRLKTAIRMPLQTIADNNNVQKIQISPPSTSSVPHHSSQEELQGLSSTPFYKKEVGEEIVKRRLKCRLSVQDLVRQSYMSSEDHHYAGPVLSYLLHAETKLVANPRVRSETRADMINWLMKINGVDGNPATIQTAVWYLDSVLAASHVTLEKMQLVAATAYWIADKIQGHMTSSSDLIECANHTFTLKSLVETEIDVLFKLKFPHQPVVPQDYMCYLAWCCKNEHPGVIEVAATFVCLCGMMVNTKLCREYPSVIAAASIRTALLLLRKKELIPRLQSCTIYLKAEKKAAGNLSPTCALLEQAVRTVAAKNYTFSFIFEQYGVPPTYIAQSVASAANELAVAGF